MGAFVQQPAGQPQALPFPQELRRRAQHKHAHSAQSLPEQVGHAIGSFRSRQQHRQPFAGTHQHAHAHGKKIPGLRQIAGAEGQSFGRSGGAGAAQRHHALHFIQGDRQEILGPLQRFGPGEGQGTQPGGRGQIQIIRGELPAVKTGTPCPGQGPAQQFGLQPGQTGRPIHSACGSACRGQACVQRAGRGAGGQLHSG